MGGPFLRPLSARARALSSHLVVTHFLCELGEGRVRPLRRLIVGRDQVEWRATGGGGHARLTPDVVLAHLQVVAARLHDRQRRRYECLCKGLPQCCVGTLEASVVGGLVASVVSTLVASVVGAPTRLHGVAVPRGIRPYRAQKSEHLERRRHGRLRAQTHFQP